MFSLIIAISVPVESVLLAVRTGEILKSMEAHKRGWFSVPGIVLYYHASASGGTNQKKRYKGR
jgi:hypothetical protein